MNGYVFYMIEDPLAKKTLTRTTDANQALHLTGSAQRFYETSNALWSARLMNPIVTGGQIPPPAMPMADLRFTPNPDPYFPKAKQASSLSLRT